MTFASFQASTMDLAMRMTRSSPLSCCWKDPWLGLNVLATQGSPALRPAMYWPRKTSLKFPSLNTSLCITASLAVSLDPSRCTDKRLRCGSALWVWLCARRASCVKGWAGWRARRSRCSSSSPPCLCLPGGGGFDSRRSITENKEPIFLGGVDRTHILTWAYMKSS